MEKNVLNLEELANGAFAERAKQAIQEVMKNIADPNTEYKLKRKVTLELLFRTGEDRQIIECDVVAKTRLAPNKAVHAKFLLDKNLDGEVIASEFGKQISGQTAMKVDKETGEITTNIKDEKTVKGLELVK